jgi:O-antigen/teichoic acid export membrane protein
VAQNLTAKTARGIKWTSISTITHTVLQIGYTAIMARWLDKVDFGLVATSLVVLHFGSYLSQMGMAQAIIQKKDLSEPEIRAAFTSNMILCTFFFLLFVFLAPFAPYLDKDHNPDIIPVLRWMSLAILFEGFSTTSLSLIRRDLKFKAFAIRNMLSYIIGYILIGVGAAYMGWGVWSLVLAYLSQTFINAVFSYVIARHSLVPIFSWKYYQPLFEYGSKISIISFLEFFGHSIDTLIINRLAGSGALGVYNRAGFIINIPMMQLTRSLSLVLFPSLSKIQGETDRLRKVYLSAITLIAFLLIPIGVGVFFAADAIIHVMLGNKWDEAIPILQILALSAPFRFTSHFGGVVCNATASLNPKLKLQIVYVVLMCILFFVFSPWGLVGFAWAILISEAFKNFGYMFVIKKIVQFEWQDLWIAYRGGIYAGLITALLIWAITASLKWFNLPIVVVFGGAIVGGALSLLLALFIKPNQAIRLEIAEKVEKIVNKRANSKPVAKLLAMLKA